MTTPHIVWHARNPKPPNPCTQATQEETLNNIRHKTVEYPKQLSRLAKDFIKVHRAE